MLLLTFYFHHGLAPAYLTDLIREYSRDASSSLLQSRKQFFRKGRVNVHTCTRKENITPFSIQHQANAN